MSASFPTAHTWSNRCALFPRGLHFGLVYTNQGHVLETLTAEPEVLQPLATCLRRQNELIDLANRASSAVPAYSQDWRSG